MDSSQSEFLPYCLATGIGSLPHPRPDEALELILSEMPEIPHWPQLPRRGESEHFIHQFLQPLVVCGLAVHRNDRWVVDPSGEYRADCLTDFYTTCLPAEDGSRDCLQSFLPSPEAAAGFYAFLARAKAGGLKAAQYVKGQIAGPLTAGLSLKDTEGRPAYYNGDLRDTIVRTLALNARCQAAALSLVGCTPIIFVDDPAISACGSRFHLALGRDMVLEDLTFIVSAIQREGAIAGLHACEAVDWSLVMESGARILSLDAYRFGSTLIPYAMQVRDFLARGGVIAWGVVPTLDDPFGESAQSLKQRLNALWDELFASGPDRESVLRQSLITPACGTGLLTEEKACRIYRLTAEVSGCIRN